MAIEKTLFLDEALEALQNQQLTTLTLQAIKKKEKDPHPNFIKVQQSLSGHKGAIRCVATLPNGCMVSGSEDNTLKVWDVKTGTCVQTLSGHTGFICCVAVLDNECVVSGSKDNTLKVWAWDDAEPGICVQTLSGHIASIACVAVLQEARVISGSMDHTLKVWNSRTGRCLQTLNGHTGSVCCVAALQDGRVISGSMDNTIKVWDIKTGKCVQTLSEHAQGVSCIGMLPDGRIVSGSMDNTIKVWDMQTGKCLQTLSGHGHAVSCVAVLPDERIVSGSMDNTIKVWDIKTGKCVQTLSGHTEAVSCIAILPDGRIVSGSMENTLTVWEPEENVLDLTSQDQAILLTAIQKNTSLTILDLSGVALISIPQGLTLLATLLKQHPVLSKLNLSRTGLIDTQVDEILWVLQTQKRIQEITVQGNLLSPQALASVKAYHESLLSPEAKPLPSEQLSKFRTLKTASRSTTPDKKRKSVNKSLPGGIENSLFLYDALKALQAQQLKTLVLKKIKKKEGFRSRHLLKKGHTDWVQCVAVLQNGHVVSGSMDNTIKVWDVKTETCMRTLEGYKDPARQKGHKDPVVQIGHKDSVRCIAALQDECVVSGSMDHTLKVWDLKIGTCLQTLHGHTASVYCVAVLQDGSVVSGSMDNTIKVWDVKTGICMQTLSGHTKAVSCIAMLPDGRVVSGSMDNTIKVWDVKTGICIQTLRGHMKAVSCVAVLPDGRVVSGSKDQTLKVWDGKTGKCVQTLSGHTDSFSCIAVLPNGRLVVSGSNDCMLKIWDVETETCVTSTRHTHPINCVAMLPDGQWVSGASSMLTVWEFEEKISDLTPEDQAILLSAAQKNTSLNILNLSGMALNSILEGWTLLKKLVEQHPTLYKLNLSYTGLTDRQVDEILPILQAQKRIRSFIVKDNPLSSTALDAIKTYHESLPPLSAPPKLQKVPSEKREQKKEKTIKRRSLPLKPKTLKRESGKKKPAIPEVVFVNDKNISSSPLLQRPSLTTFQPKKNVLFSTATNYPGGFFQPESEKEKQPETKSSNPNVLNN